MGVAWWIVIALYVLAMPAMAVLAGEIANKSDVTLRQTRILMVGFALVWPPIAILSWVALASTFWDRR